MKYKILIVIGLSLLFSQMVMAVDFTLNCPANVVEGDQATCTLNYANLVPTDFGGFDFILSTSQNLNLIGNPTTAYGSLLYNAGTGALAYNFGGIPVSGTLITFNFDANLVGLKTVDLTNLFVYDANSVRTSVPALSASIDVLTASISVCGNSVLEFATEECDDGNLVNGDGCDSLCRIETGWTCPSPGLPCIPPVSACTEAQVIAAVNPCACNAPMIPVAVSGTNYCTNLLEDMKNSIESPATTTLQKVSAMAGRLKTFFTAVGLI